ncbi:MAG: hypothetical protein ACYC54_13080 [Sedimentisphaerales bacterium]
MIKDHNVLVGMALPSDIEALETFCDLKLGNFLFLKMPYTKNKALEVARFCRDKKIHFMFSEFLKRGSFDICMAPPHELCFQTTNIGRQDFFSTEDLEEIFAAGGEYYYGRVALGEAGGHLYWPEPYLLKQNNNSWTRLEPAENVLQAKRHFMDCLKNIISFERKKLHNSRLVAIDASMTFKYLIESGVDEISIEMMPGNCDLIIAAIRGASKLLQERKWGALVAMGWYGGCDMDELWLKRWKTSLCRCFISGSSYICLETGLLRYLPAKTCPSTHSYDFNDVRVKTARKIFREFYQFVGIHSRCSNQPVVKLGIVYGNCDGFAGLWGRHVWGQFDDSKWLVQDAERGWELIETLYRKSRWFDADVQSSADFDGKPPAGQIDIVPIEASTDVLKEYSCLVFLGFNVMTAEIYGKLKEYVENGGHLVMTASQLNCAVDRASEIDFFNDGDYTDLFGVKVTRKIPPKVTGVKFVGQSEWNCYKMPVRDLISDPRCIGHINTVQSEIIDAKVLCAYSDMFRDKLDDLLIFPALTEKKFGHGISWLIHTTDYPGTSEFKPFMERLLKIIAAGQNYPIRVYGSDNIEYAIYKDINTGMDYIYLLNTDYYNTQFVTLECFGKSCDEIKVKPAEMTVAFYFNGVVFVFEDKAINIQTCNCEKDTIFIQAFIRKEQNIVVFNLSGTPKTININGICGLCENKAMFQVNCRIDQEKKSIFNDDFVEESDAIVWLNPDMSH